MRIFVEVNETLLRLDDQNLIENEGLIEALKLMNGAAPIIVWAEQGTDYAYAFAEDILPRHGVHYHHAMIRIPRVAVEGDIIIDNDPHPSYLMKGTRMTSDEFERFAQDWRKTWDESHVYADLAAH